MERKVVVTLARHHPINDVLERLQQDGLREAQVLEEIGVIVGRVEESKMDVLRAELDVLNISEDTEVNIAPPDARDTW